MKFTDSERLIWQQQEKILYPNTMDAQTIALCNKVNDEIQQDRFNTRMILIQRCFDYDKFLKVDEKSLKDDPYYYNTYFDQLMKMSLEELEEWEIKMFKITKDYGQWLSNNSGLLLR